MTEINYGLPSQSAWNEICGLVQAGMSVGGRDFLVNSPAKFVNRHIVSLTERIERLKAKFHTANLAYALGNLPADKEK